MGVKDRVIKKYLDNLKREFLEEGNYRLGILLSMYLAIILILIKFFIFLIKVFLFNKY